MENRNYSVYIHTNRINGKVYIGVTKNDLRRRTGANGTNYRQCTYFNNAIKKYGWDNFSHDIFDDHLTKEEASELERFLVSFHQSNIRENGYNIQPGGLHAGGMSPEGFERFRQASIEATRKPIVSFSRDGKRLKEFASITEAASFYGVSDSGIEAALYQENKTCKGMLFRFASDVTDFVDMSEEYLNEHVRVRHYKNGKHAKCADVVLFDSDGKRIGEFGSSKECAQYLGVYHGSVSGVLTGRHNTVKCCYVRLKSDVGDAMSIPIEGIDRSKRIGVSLVDDDGNELQSFSSLHQAAKYIGGDPKALKDAAIYGRLYHGKRWRLKE